MYPHALGIGLAVALTCTASAEAAKLQTLATIPARVDGTYPLGLVNVGGMLYGTTLGGGQNGVAESQSAGTIFTIDPSTGSETVAFSFPANTALSNPGPQLLNVGGILYGVTNSLYEFQPNSAIFSFNPATGTLTSLYTFAGEEGSHPDIPLIQVGSLLYGTSCEDGSSSAGYVFSFDPSSNTLTTLYSFTGMPSDGNCPQGPLANIGGVIYGATAAGGTANDGTLFSFDTSTNTETTLYSFQNGSDGAGPDGLAQLGGLLYGVTDGSNAPAGSPTLFSFNPANATLNTLYSFARSSACDPYVSGLTPQNGLIYASADTCVGSQSVGQVISFNPATQAVSAVYTVPSSQAGSPSGPLAFVGTTLYGTCYSGGPILGQQGDVYSVDLTSGTGAVVHSFVQPDGADDFTSTLLRVGKLYYGVSAFGGDSDRGALFSFDPAGSALNVLHTFGGADGSNPHGDLLYAGGAIWGTTLTGGTNNAGTVFSFDPTSGSETVAYSFASSSHDGANPRAGLIDVSGTFYGTTANGGAHGNGTIYAFHAANGREHTTYAFTGGSGGATPSGPLTALGNLLYGTTQGASYGRQRGTLYSFDPSTQQQQVLIDFTSVGKDAPDGANPFAGVTPLGGLLYGTTYAGGSHDWGTVFSFDPSSNTESVIFSFNARGPKKSPGAWPEAPLTVSGTSLFGATFLAPHGTGAAGTVFSLDTVSGTETTYYDFTGGSDGGRSTGGLAPWTSGRFLGTTSYSNAADIDGTVFSLRP